MTVRIIGVKFGHATLPCLSVPASSTVLWRSGAMDRAKHANRDGLLDLWVLTAKAFVVTTTVTGLENRD
jgi:hypothetical protein